jgi:O-antigen/teichoic acid export membrane protein
MVAVGGLALWLWHLAGYWGLAGLACGALGLAAIFLWTIHRRIMRGPVPFAGTVDEFRKDADCLRQIK